MTILLLILSIINLLFFILAQLNVWLPITFKKLGWFNARFAGFILLKIFAAWIIIKWFRNRNEKSFAPSDIEILKHQIKTALHSDDYTTMIKREYQYNWLALLFHQILLTIAYATIG